MSGASAHRNVEAEGTGIGAARASKSAEDPNTELTHKNQIMFRGGGQKARQQ